MPSKEKQSEYNRRYYAKNKDAQRERTRKWRNANREKFRAISRRSDGLPEPTRPCPERCEICGGLPGNKAMHLDHCHLTGEFRGWLCWRCNGALAALGDCAVALQRAMRYLERFESVAYA